MCISGAVEEKALIIDGRKHHAILLGTHHRRNRYDDQQKLELCCYNNRLGIFRMAG